MDRVQRSVWLVTCIAMLSIALLVGLLHSEQAKASSADDLISQSSIGYIDKFLIDSAGTEQLRGCYNNVMLYAVDEYNLDLSRVDLNGIVKINALIGGCIIYHHYQQLFLKMYDDEDPVDNNNSKGGGDGGRSNYVSSL